MSSVDNIRRMVDSAKKKNPKEFAKKAEQGKNHIIVDNTKKKK